MSFNNQNEFAEKTAGELAVLVNNFSFSPQPFVDAVMRQHRTLQQSLFGLFLKCIEKWANLSESQFDLRNEWTVKMSKKIMESLKDDYFGRPPLV